MNLKVFIITSSFKLVSFIYLEININIFVKFNIL